MSENGGKMICAVAVPLYKPTPTSSECASLLQAARVLNRYPFRFFCPDGFDFSRYAALLNGTGVSYEIFYFAPEFFCGISGYSRLLLNPVFYRRFSDWEYLLIYQLDAWVFRDELEEWCAKRYDYIGAPWFIRLGRGRLAKKMEPLAGNGGLSLRRIPAMIRILEEAHRAGKTVRVRTFAEIFHSFGFWRWVLAPFAAAVAAVKYGKRKNRLDVYLKSHSDYEDRVLLSILHRHFPMNPAPSEVAERFAWECNAEYLYDRSGGELPFGCHAFLRYEPGFWSRFIPVAAEKRTED